MRILGIICILMITLTIQYSADITPLRQFLNGFLSTIKGDRMRILLPENCLGKSQEEEFNKFLESIEGEHPLLALAMSHQFLTDLQLNCPIKEIELIIADMKILLFNDKKNIFDNVYLQAGNLIGIFEEFEMEIKKQNAQHDKADTVGRFVGKAFNKILYENDYIHKNLKFLEIGINDQFSHEDNVIPSQNFNQVRTQDANQETTCKTTFDRPMELFVDGFFEGVSSVPFERNKCHTDIIDVKSNIVDTVENLINAIRSETGLIDALMKMYELLTQLKGLDANCHFEALSIDILSLTTKTGAAKLLYRISTHLISTMADLNSMYSNMKIKEFRKCGVSFGLLIKTALNYSTI